MDFYISVKDLGVAILFLTAIIALVFLCLALYKIIKLIGKLTNIVDTNKANIDNTMNQLPDTVTNINSVLDGVKDTAESATTFIEGISDTASETAVSLEKACGEYADIIKSVIAIILKVKDVLK